MLVILVMVFCISGVIFLVLIVFLVYIKKNYSENIVSKQCEILVFLFFLIRGIFIFKIKYLKLENLEKIMNKVDQLR